MFAYTKKINQVLLMWFTSMSRNDIPINGPILHEEIANLLTPLIATLSRYQTDGLEDGKRGTPRLSLYTFLYVYTVYIRRNVVND